MRQVQGPRSSWVPVLLRCAQFLEPRGCRFQVAPLGHFRVKFIEIDKTSFGHLMRRVIPILTTAGARDLYTTLLETVTNVHSFETSNRKYADSFMTDGVGVRILMQKPAMSRVNAVLVDRAADDGIVFGQPRRPPGFHDYECVVQGAPTANVISVDFGETDFLNAGFKKDGVMLDEKLSITTKQYYNDSKINISQDRHNSLVRANADICRVLPSFSGHKRTCHLFLLSNYLLNVSSNFRLLHDFFGKRKMRRLRMTREMGKDTAVDTYAKMMVERIRSTDNTEVTVVFGDAAFRSKRGYKKRGRPAYNRLVHACRKSVNVQVRVVNEAYSSSFCWRCFWYVDFVPRRHCTDIVISLRRFIGRQPAYRTKHCRRCKQQFNRDVVGHRNIMHIYMWLHEFEITEWPTFDTMLAFFEELSNLTALGPHLPH